MALRKTQRGIWETNVKKLDLTNPRVLRFYVERKILSGDWGALDRKTVRAVLPHLSIDPYLREVIGDAIGSPQSYEATHRSAKKITRRRGPQ